MSFGTLAFDSTDPYSNSYNSSTVKGYLDSIVAGTAGDGKPNFSDVANAIKPVTLTTNKFNSTDVYETVNNVKLYLLSTEEAKSLPVNVRKAEFTGGDCDNLNQWWLRSPGSSVGNAAVAYGDGSSYVNEDGFGVGFAYGVRPALKLDLSAVTFSSNTFTVKPYAAYDVTKDANKNKSGDDLTALQVTFNERKWYIIEDNSSSATSGTVTLLSADPTFGTKKFDDVNDSNKYSTSQVKTYLDSMTGTGGAFAGVAEAIETVNLTTNQYNSTDVYETVNNVKLYLLSTEEAKSLPENVRKAEFTGEDCSDKWWLRSPGCDRTHAASVYGDSGNVYDDGDTLEDALGVRPALKLDLSAVIFSSNTFTLKPYVSLKNTTTPVHFDNKDWYLIDFDATTVTLLSKECVGASTFGTNNTYSGSTVEGAVNNYYTNSISASAKTAVNGNGMFLLTTDQANAIKNANKVVLKCPKAEAADLNCWWLRSPGCDLDGYAACVDGSTGEVGENGLPVSNKLGVRPALKLDLSAVYFASDTNTFTVNPYFSLVNTTTPVKFNGIDWYIIADNSTAVNAGTVTLLAKDPIGAKKFGSSNEYKDSTVKGYLEGLTTGNDSFAGVANVIVPTDLSDVSVTGAKLWLLSKTQADGLNVDVRICSMADGAENNIWWLRSPGNSDTEAAYVFGNGGLVGDGGHYVGFVYGMRPALKLNLPSVNFTSVNISGGANATTSGGSTSQNYFDVGSTYRPMTKVTYTADTGYQFPATSDLYKNTSGITVDRSDDPTIVEVSGTPTAVVSITVPDAVAIPATAPNITAQPSGAALTSGYATGATLTVEATAATDTTYNALTYQWYSCDDTSKTNPQAIDNATGASYTFPTGKSEGNYYCVVTATRTDNSATATTTSSVATVTVNAATPPTPPKPNPPSSTPTPTKPTAYVKTAPVANTLTYSEQPQELVTAGESTGGEMLYALGNSKSSMPTSGWSTSIPTATDAGTYFVWYKAKGDSYHRDSSPKCVTVTIGKGSSSVTTVPKVKTLIQSKEPQELITAGEATGGTIQYALGTSETTAPEDGWSTEIPTATDAGTYFVWCKVVGDNNHEDSDPSYAGATTIIENHSDNVLAIDEEKGIATVRDAVSGGTTEVPLYVITEGLTYRMYDPNRGEHFYTKNPEEAESLVQAGWIHESGSDFTVVSALEEDAAPVYRLYNPNCGGMHFYTTDAEEAKYLKSIGWNYEGISHYVYKATSTKGTPQHRLYNPNSPSAEHLWTSDEAEVDMLIAVGWIYEGICWRIV